MDRRSRIEIAVAGTYASIWLVIALGCFLYPDLFWDRFFWKYFWGPIEADAGLTTRTTADYNWVDTLTYGVTLALASYFIHRLFVKMDLRVGTGFFLALSPIIMIGPTARALEDMEFFNRPLEFIFISPVIYIFLGLLTLATIITAYRIEKLGKEGGRASWLFLMIPGLSVSLVISAFPGWLEGHVSIIPILLITLSAAFLHQRIFKQNRWEAVVGSFWVQILLFIIYFYVLWGMGGEWYDSYSMRNNEPQTAFLSGLGIIILVIAVTSVVVLSIHVSSKKWKITARMLIPVNVMIIGGHMLDASATFVGIDFHGYLEKHVVPENLMSWLGSTGFPYPGMIMFPLKLIFLIPALYYMDVKMREESMDNPHLMALVKLAILVLGFAPGARDLIRLSLGV